MMEPSQPTLRLRTHTESLFPSLCGHRSRVAPVAPLVLKPGREDTQDDDQDNRLADSNRHYDDLHGCSLRGVGTSVRRAGVCHRPVESARPADSRHRPRLRGTEQFNDSHFHLTNYVQEGIDVRKFLEIMGTRVGRSTLFGIPLQQTVVVRQHRRLRADLLPADRRAALLLLVHRRVHRDGLPVADARSSRRASTR